MTTTAFDPVGKLLRHPAHVAAFLSEHPDAWKCPPIGVEISPTNHCAAKCPWCFYVSSEYKQHHSQEELDVGQCHGLIDSLWRAGVKSITWTGGGDPCEYSNIDESIGIASSLGIRQGMFTNGYRRVDNAVFLDWIRITITEKFVLTKHVKDYVDAGVDVGVNFNVTDDNHREIRRLLDEAISLGVKYFQVRPALADRADLQRPVLFPEWILQYFGCGVDIETTHYKWKEYLKPHGYPVCHGHRMVPFVWHNGDVAVCAYHFGRPEFTFGNLREQTFEEIWTGERRRGMIERGVGVIRECQSCCKLHEVNKVLAKQPEHLEFV
jgi:cyclic pyranopterin phosphate synthase